MCNLEYERVKISRLMKLITSNECGVQYFLGRNKVASFVEMENMRVLIMRALCLKYERVVVKVLILI